MDTDLTLEKAKKIMGEAKSGHILPKFAAARLSQKESKKDPIILDAIDRKLRYWQRAHTELD